MRRRVPRHRRLAYSLALVVVTLLAGELVCRAREGPIESRYAPMEADPYRGAVLTPGARFQFDGRSSTINSLGMRGPEGGPKRPGVVRILCVGGSSTYGLFIADDASTWPARLEQALRTRGVETEVLNAGVPSWTARSSQTNLDLRLYDLRPDVIVVCHLFNDLVIDPRSTYFRDSFVEDASELWRPARLSALMRTLDRKLHRVQGAEAKATLLAPGREEAFTRNLRRMVERSREHGAVVVLTTEPSCLRPTHAASAADRVPGLEPWLQHYSTLEYDALLAGSGRFRTAIRDVATELDAPFVDLEPIVPDDVRYWRSPIHHSELGEQVVAEHLAAELLRREVIGARSDDHALR